MRLPSKNYIWAPGIALLVSGCSFFMRPVAPDYQVSEPPRCSESLAAPILDGAGGTYMLAVAAYGTAICGSEDTDFKCDARLALLYLPSAILYAMGTWGFYKRAKCRRTKHAHRDWLRAQPPTPTPQRS